MFPGTIRGNQFSKKLFRRQACMNRRTFLDVSLAVAVSLTGCGGGVGQTVVPSGTSPPISIPAASVVTPTLFPGVPDPPDLTARGEIPPTELPNLSLYFGPDPATDAPRNGQRSGLDTFDHVVVLMFENRAFDHVLGYLYPGGQSPSGQPFDGVSGKTFINPIPSYAQDSDRKTIEVSPAASLQVPYLDPAEQYGAVNLSLFGEFNPASNQFAPSEGDFLPPYNVPDGGAFFPPPMNGFVRQFIYRLTSYYKIANPTYEQYSTIMQCFTPNLVPVISQLAQAFGICDRWHCGVPSQTYTNRSFFHAASASGLLVNSPKVRWTGFPFVDKGNDAPTIFDALTRAGRTWTIYYDPLDVISLTRLIHHPTLGKYPFAHPYFKGRIDFWDDVENGRLPDYAFVEPRFFPDDNSYHPEHGAPAVKRGEVLLNDVYTAIRRSNTANGSNYQNTLFVVTFDEGGTCFDHVPPPSATPPGDGYPGQFGFNFDRLGQRIPTLLVSAYIEAGTVIHTSLDANSLIRSLEVKWGLDPLTVRDAASTPLSGVFNRGTPRPRSEWPTLLVRKLSAQEAQSDLDAPLISEGLDIVGLFYALETGLEGLPPGVVTNADAIAWLNSRPSL